LTLLLGMLLLPGLALLLLLSVLSLLALPLLLLARLALIIVFIFLSANRSSDSKYQEQGRRCTDSSKSFHNFLPYLDFMRPWLGASGAVIVWRGSLRQGASDQRRASATYKTSAMSRAGATIPTSPRLFRLENP
jgi:hypothetical protein